MSGFGRAAKENGTRGAGHGHANVMFVMGGRASTAEQLYEGRDLNITADFRGALGELVANRLGNCQITEVFPGYLADARKFRGVVGRVRSACGNMT